MACSKFAQTLVRQCEDRAIRCDVLAVEEVGDLNTLLKYTALFLVSPAPAEGTEGDETFAQLEMIYAFYRERKPQGLDSMLTAGHPWWFAGPVHVYLLGRGSRDDNPFPALALDKPCVVRFFADEKSLGDIFEDYCPPTVQPDFDPNQYLLENGVKYWKLVRDWGVQTLAESDAIYGVIETQREYYNDPRFPTLSKPRESLKHRSNRLDQVLEDPQMKLAHGDFKRTDLESIKKARKAYQESGAKVVRETLKVIRTKYPHVTRPDERTNTKDNQKAFKDLYDAVAALRGLPPAVREQIARS
ncbi:hypothetical protein [Lentzea terrae]|uniref:hypothetical protein n=1 Tax=Lentzea terrae TaxID=2200761 RepID=UPI001300AA46|nr:hypothetical protein [Lentzea terrae]